MKVIDALMWIMFTISSVVAMITVLVLFGISYNNLLKIFSTMLPLEISLALTFFLWGLNSLYGSYLPDNKPKVPFFYLPLEGYF